MIYSSACKYAMKAMIDLAGRSDSKPVPLKILANAQGISSSFLQKILQVFSRRGYVLSTKGPGGGYRLDRGSGVITLLEIINAIDGPLCIDSVCIMGINDCNTTESCKLHSEWSLFGSRLLSTLQKTTIAEIAHKSSGDTGGEKQNGPSISKITRVGGC